MLTEDEENERLEREVKKGNGDEKRKSRWRDVGNLTRTLALVKSWRADAHQSTEEYTGDVGEENGANG